MDKRTSKPTLALIIGAGFAGVGMAIKLLEQGITDFVILERASDVGGTWRDNTYPGVACDVPSIAYSYSFEPNPHWSKTFSDGAEILDYIRGMVDRHGLRGFIRFDTDVSDTRFDEESGTWTTRTTSGEVFTSRAVVGCQGPLANASLPNIRGIDSFTGRKILSAKWDHDYDFRGKRVAVIGTGASAVQIVPELVKQVEFLKVFQRTPGWMLPRSNPSTPGLVKKAFGRFPRLQSLVRQGMFYGSEAGAVGLVWDTPATGIVRRAAKAHLARQVADPFLRRQLTPIFTPGCKRILISNDYYPALQKDNCQLIFWPIAEISPDGIKTSDGIEHRFDCIVFATGYDVAKTGSPLPIFGRDGRELDVEWAKGVYGYRSVAVSGYPNLFLTFGPNSGPGHTSALIYVEAQINYIVAAITTILEQDLRYMDVDPVVQSDHNVELQRRLANTTWNSGCSSWYLTDDGFNGTMFPGFATQFVRQLAEVDITHYNVVGNPRPEGSPPPLVEDPAVEVLGPQAAAVRSAT